MRKEIRTLSYLYLIKILVFTVAILSISTFCFSASGDSFPFKSEVKASYSHSSDSNIYRSNEDKKSDNIETTKFNISLSQTEEKRTNISLDFSTYLKHYRKFSDEDVNNYELDFSLDYFHSKNTTSNFSYEHVENKTSTRGESKSNYYYDTDDYILSSATKLTDTKKLKIGIGGERQRYRDYETINKNTEKYYLEYNEDIGNFTEYTINYTQKKDEYVDNYNLEKSIIDDTEYYFTSDDRRTDKKRIFSIEYTKTFSLNPIMYIMLSATDEKNNSDSTYLYTYYDENEEWKNWLIGSYDSYDEVSLSFFGVKGIGKRDMLTLYYLYEKTDYRNKFLEDEFGFLLSPLIPKVDEFRYSYILLRHNLGEKYSIDFSYTKLDSDSNDSNYTYKEKITSIGINAKF